MIVNSVQTFNRAVPAFQQKDSIQRIDINGKNRTSFPLNNNSGRALPFPVAQDRVLPGQLLLINTQKPKADVSKIVKPEVHTLKMINDSHLGKKVGVSILAAGMSLSGLACGGPVSSPSSPTPTPPPIVTPTQGALQTQISDIMDTLGIPQSDSEKSISTASAGTPNEFSQEFFDDSDATGVSKKTGATFNENLDKTNSTSDSYKVNGTYYDNAIGPVTAEKYTADYKSLTNGYNVKRSYQNPYSYNYEKMGNEVKVYRIKDGTTIKELFNTLVKGPVAGVVERISTDGSISYSKYTKYVLK